MEVLTCGGSEVDVPPPPRTQEAARSDFQGPVALLPVWLPWDVALLWEVRGRRSGHEAVRLPVWPSAPPWWHDCPVGAALGSQSARLGFGVLGARGVCTWCSSGAVMPNVHQQVRAPFWCPPYVLWVCWAVGCSRQASAISCGCLEGSAGAAVRPGEETPPAALCLETTAPPSLSGFHSPPGTHTGSQSCCLIPWTFPRQK